MELVQASQYQQLQHGELPWPQARPLRYSTIHRNESSNHNSDSSSNSNSNSRVCTSMSVAERVDSGCRHRMMRKWYDARAVAASTTAALPHKRPDCRSHPHSSSSGSSINLLLYSRGVAMPHSAAHMQRRRQDESFFTMLPNLPDCRDLWMRGLASWTTQHIRGEQWSRPRRQREAS